MPKANLPKMVRVMGTTYELHRAPLAMNPGMFGATTGPVKQRGVKPFILVAEDLPPDKEMRTLIHECLHACDMKKSEKWVDRASKDIARVLKRHGFTRK